VHHQRRRVFAAGNGNTLTLIEFPFRFILVVTRLMYLAEGTCAENNSGWQAMGVWQVPGEVRAPTTLSVNESRARRGELTDIYLTFQIRGLAGSSVVNILLMTFWTDAMRVISLRTSIMCSIW